RPTGQNVHALEMSSCVPEPGTMIVARLVHSGLCGTDLTMIELVGFDGDDTLWHSEGYYRHAEAAFIDIMHAWTDTDDATVAQRLLAEEQRTLGLYGYGA